MLVCRRQMQQQLASTVLDSEQARDLLLQPDEQVRRGFSVGQGAPILPPQGGKTQSYGRNPDGRTQAGARGLLYPA